MVGVNEDLLVERGLGTRRSVETQRLRALVAFPIYQLVRRLSSVRLEVKFLIFLLPHQSGRVASTDQLCFRYLLLD